jgi:hypothetical protein
VPHAELTQMQELPPEMQPHLAKPPRIDEGEAFLTSLFLPDTSHTTGGEGHMHKCKGPHDYFAA